MLVIRQVDVVCSVGEEGNLEHHVVAFEQLYRAVGVVVVEVEGKVFQRNVGAVGRKVCGRILELRRIIPMYNECDGKDTFSRR